MLSRSDWRDAAAVHRGSAAVRVVTQLERVWVVREANTSLAPNAPRDHCLLCESSVSMRCTWEYPREWARLSDAEILQLFN